MSWKKELRKYDVNEDVFNKILTDYSKHIVKVDDINKYKFGYKDTDLEGQSNEIAYDGSEWLIMKEFMLNGVLNDHDINRFDYTDVVPLDNTWRQCIVRLTHEQIQEVEAGVDGLYAYNYINKMLKKYYAVEEVEERLNMFTAEYDPNKIQEHYVLNNKYELLQFENCYKYDINSAHAAALIDIFPKAKEAITKLYEQRKVHPKNKALLNYYVGYLCRVNHRTTYNWIVQRTTDTLRNAAKEVDGDIIYANTDGIIVQNPKKLLNTSTQIGEFKEEYRGTVYFYKDKNWFVYELDTDDIKDKHRGTLALSARPLVDLKNRTIVHYDKIKTTNAFEIKNIEKEII